MLSYLMERLSCFKGPNAPVESKWNPLPSDPSLINTMIENMGVSGIKAVDVVGFDDDSIGNEQYAVILCFPYNPEVRENIRQMYSELKEPEESIFFMKQSEEIGNACGSFALIHSLTNLEERIDLGNGHLAKWLKDAKKVSVEERSNLLANNKGLAKIHKTAAGNGTAVSNPDGRDGQHFVCYVGKNGTLYEIDSRQSFARVVGPATDENLVQNSGAGCQHLIGTLDSIRFSAVALVKQ
ncbi:hypothetical protein GCK72_017938 [Caenorhabditis remanei]|uniref:Ubiquitin carboxyl-terminal hydrolase n=1 Tax=Caenorhabditis remanei TaxID=31234 RepID=A0A6A5G9S5_CAERE|nr:hypothetical protein GCK72_017938 [Caenorhabditis remanei]KAF1751384.1 hypothetical protein GCK72_017938 [Caenorhabditis remanei]